MPDVQTFWTEPTEEVELSLRRFAWSSEDRCPVNRYHNATVRIGRAPVRMSEDGFLAAIHREEFDGDERWPLTCECGYVFVDDDQWQVNQHPYYRAADGREWARNDLPPGAMFDAWWMSDFWRGPDGIALQVILPNGNEWAVDARASNCSRPDEPHQCWVRHGDPRTEPVTVDKEGDTCSAGAGSILSGDYHGFLRAGVLVDA